MAYRHRDRSLVVLELLLKPHRVFQCRLDCGLSALGRVEEMLAVNVS